MILVTGAAGFIGANLVHALSARQPFSVFGVDNMSRPEKFHNIVDAEIADYLDKEDFIARLKAGQFDGKFSAVLHQGACSNTMETDGRYMMKNNYEYTVELFEFCQREGIPFIYASSAAVYGGGTVFREERPLEKPLNVYGYSKFLFDQYLRRYWQARGKDAGSQMVGLRYFNVYGPLEQHKGTMASVPFHQYHQFLKEGKVKLFGANEGYEAGTQMRDFIYIEDVVKVNLFFLDNPDKRGIFNLGTGRAQPFNDLAIATVNALANEGKPTMTLDEILAKGLLEYLPFPDKLKGKYQSFTQADISALREVGYREEFTDVATGVAKYMDFLRSQPAR
ncbi:ADP-glyceromanno-heptose 6-epimerase [Massilia niastensis]|uniref:ADP-glyceromanno-heptose 6-epimerase n=1 Tax=Massilia niastensis TaxID=544911 RepID=UPI0003A38A82|nr:ADP-glyceromanno-heptose 6-epimerase [Massilia niastensis]